ncbi:MAG: hypothetical protein E6J72_08010 [Deltaproteobacteria bacterium]|nr:MAG: hypothetical protein E6J72_08010 [Deltaproteobacteria bacterium]
MTSLLTSDAFPEPWVDAEAAGASFVAEARFEGVIVCTRWPRPDVMPILAPGLSLGRNATAEAHLHPVAFVFGMQSDAALIVGGVTVPSGARFPELMIAVPFVRRHEDTNLHVFIPRVYSSDQLSTWSGTANYGLGKQLADMRWLSRTFTVAARGGPLLLHATVESEGDWRPFDRVPGLTATTDVFRRPALGRRHDGTDVRSYFDWRPYGATARPARAVLSIDAPLGPGLVPRICHGIGGETFAVRDMRWRISWPLRCDAGS